MTQLEFSYQLNLQEAPLRGMAKYLTKNEEDSKDLLQDTMLKAYLYRESFISGSSMRAWLSTIMRNVYFNDRKRSQKFQKVPVDLSDLAGSYSVVSTTEDPQSIMNSKDIINEVNKLTDTVRIPFELCNDGYQYDEIASELGISLPAVKSRIFYARKHLQKAVTR